MVSEFNVALNNLLEECADAMSRAATDNACRDQHLRAIEEALNHGEVDAACTELLLRVASQMKAEVDVDPLQLAVMPRTESAELSSLLYAELHKRGFAGHVYHGTVLGRLSGIAKYGMLPSGGPSAWKGHEHLIDHRASAVFFAPTWRAAAGWAEITHLKSRGPKNGRSRRAVVLRLSRAGLRLEADTLAASPGCLAVRDSVDTSRAEVFLGPLQGWPRWVDLDEALRSKV